VVGMLNGRDPTVMLDALVSAGVRSVVACAPNSPRALPSAQVAEAAFALGMSVAVADSPTDAVHLAVGRSAPEDLVVVCGSLYVVADARQALLRL
jgi:dihydrofolate synthase/folylpolyglutamate synthase